MTAVTTASDATDAPAPGQLVTVRNRVWVASDIVAGTIASGSATAMTQRVPHVVTLVSIEDDARDERLRVVWELERGAITHDQHALPDPADGFDDPAQLDAFLDAVRWGVIASADKTVLQAPFRSGIQIEDYQLDPVAPAGIQVPARHHPGYPPQPATPSDRRTLGSFGVFLEPGPGMVNR
jgi:hypothetical protein